MKTNEILMKQEKGCLRSPFVLLIPEKKSFCATERKIEKFYGIMFLYYVM